MRAFVNLRCFFACTAVGCLIGCGTDSGDGSSSSGGQSGSSGASGSAAGMTSAGGSSAGGSTTGGSSGSGVGGTGNGSGSGGAGNASGAGGAIGGGGSSGSGDVDVLDPSLPLPSVDCRTDTTSRICVSVSGTVAGQAVDEHCTMESFAEMIAGTPLSWIVICGEEGSFGPLSYRVDVPVQPPGQFDETFLPGAASQGDVIIQSGSSGGDVSSDNLLTARVAGHSERTAGTPAVDLVVGTFQGTWSEPTADCTTGYADECLASKVHGTFRGHYTVR